MAASLLPIWNGVVRDFIEDFARLEILRDVLGFPENGFLHDNDLNQPEEALSDPDFLSNVLRVTEADWMMKDSDLTSLHGDPEFEAIVADVNKRIGEE